MRAAAFHTSARLRRVHAVLEGGEERTTLEIVAYARVCAVNSCIAELRANGAVIACRQERRETGRVWFYRMVAPVPAEKRGG